MYECKVAYSPACWLFLAVSLVFLAGQEGPGRGRAVSLGEGLGAWRCVCVGGGSGFGGVGGWPGAADVTLLLSAPPWNDNKPHTTKRGTGPYTPTYYIMWSILGTLTPPGQGPNCRKHPQDFSNMIYRFVQQTLTHLKLNE